MSTRGTTHGTEAQSTAVVATGTRRGMIPLVGRFISPRLLKFGLVGGSGAVIKLGTMYLFTDICMIHYMLSYLLSSLLAITSNYIWNSLWTFKQSGGRSGYLRYLGISCIAVVINEGILYVLTGRLGVWYMFSAAIGILTAFAVNYILSRRFVWYKAK